MTQEPRGTAVSPTDRRGGPARDAGPPHTHTQSNVLESEMLRTALRSSRDRIRVSGGHRCADRARVLGIRRRRSALAAAARSVSRKAENASVTVPAPGAGTDATVTVSRTENLVNQTVRVSWTGFRPSSASRLDNSGDCARRQHREPGPRLPVPRREPDQLQRLLWLARASAESRRPAGTGVAGGPAVHLPRPGRSVQLHTGRTGQLAGQRHPRGRQGRSDHPTLHQARVGGARLRRRQPVLDRGRAQLRSAARCHRGPVWTRPGRGSAARSSRSACCRSTMPAR